MGLNNTTLERVILPCGDRVLRTEFMSTLRRWRDVQHLSADQLGEMQRASLRQLLEFATSEVELYRDLAASKDPDPYRWLASFPVMGKRQLAEHTDRLLTRPTAELVASPSSGSSGIQSTVWMSPAEMSRSQAYQTLMWEWSGYRLGDPLLQTGMTPDRGLVKRAKDLLLRTSYVEAFGVADERAVQVLTSPAAARSRFFGGYASSLFVFARAAARQGIDVRFDAVISWGDKMFPEYRELIETTFRTKVFDTYGTTEGIVVSGQKDLRQYYVLSPHIVLELLDDSDRPVSRGQVGRVVVTRLDGRAMPLIRYDLGDLAIEGERPESAELQFPVLDMVVGRNTDIVETPRGRHLIVHTFTGIFEFFDLIEQFRVIQRVATGIEVEYIPRPGFTDQVLSDVERRLREVIDEPFGIDFRRVEHIPDSPSGKPQIVVSELRSGPDRAGGRTP